MDIQPGNTVTIKVTARLKTTAAQKTLARLFMKDPARRKSYRWNPKPVDRTRRAGRIWQNRVRGSNLRPPNIGDSATILATVDVLQDLRSVQQYIDVN